LTSFPLTVLSRLIAFVRFSSSSFAVFSAFARSALSALSSFLMSSFSLVEEAREAWAVERLVWAVEREERRLSI
jgi:hypothetical protein